MQITQRIYLDNAATSWPKPERVYQAVERYQRELGAPAGRGTYGEAVEVERIVGRARAGIARLFGIQEARRVIFSQNCTGALNLAIHGLLKRGDHVVTTDLEHNSVLRPLRRLEDAGQITVTRVAPNAEGIIEPDAVRHATCKATRLVAITHASNVTGVVQPVAAIALAAHERGAHVLVDAAQTAGHVAIDVRSLGADLLAAPGHKGLLGPLGTGFLYVGPELERLLDPLCEGGTGTISESDRQPETLPEKYESGNLNALGIVGLEAGVAFVAERGIAEIGGHAAQLSTRLREGLAAIDGVRLHGATSAAPATGITSLTIEGLDPHDLASLLDGHYRIQGRAGMHCAPRVGVGSSFRLSVGPFNTMAQIDATIGAIAEIATQARQT
jgi:cysteine desulfurase family protein